MSPPQVWLNDNVNTLRHFGMEKRQEMNIAEGVIGPLPPVLRPWEFLKWCMGKTTAEIEAERGTVIPRLQAFTLLGA